QTLQAALQESQLVLPMTTEAPVEHTEYQMLAVDISRALHHLLPRADRSPLVADGIVERREIAGLLVETIGDARIQAPRVILCKSGQNLQVRNRGAELVTRGAPRIGLLSRRHTCQDLARRFREPAAGFLGTPHGGIGSLDDALRFVFHVHELLNVA